MCPNCKGNRCTYVVPRLKRPEGGWRGSWKPREDFKAKCPDCNWEGECL